MSNGNQQSRQTGAGSASPKAGGLFEGLSFAQVAAGALAAVTSLLLSSRIGWGGSAIGVAVGSVVSTVSSQVYKKFFQKGADKLKDIASSDPEHASGPTGTPVLDSAAMREAAGVGGGRETTAAEMGAHPMESDEEIREATSRADRNPATGTRMVSDRLAAKERERKRAKVQKSVIVVSVVSAVLAMLLSAGIVSCATSGEGLGAKPAPIAQVSKQDAGTTSSSSSSADRGAGTQQGSESSGQSRSQDDAAESAGSDKSGNGSSGAEGTADSTSSSSSSETSSSDSSSDASASTASQSGDAGSGNSGEGDASGGAGATAS